jgi:DTW domain-containing protein YfiP
VIRDRLRCRKQRSLSFCLRAGRLCRFCCSPYLRKARRVGLKPAGASQYNLRKNQKDACLCTAECVIEILRSTGRMEQAERLQERFLGFIRPPGVMRGAGRRDMICF